MIKQHLTRKQARMTATRYNQALVSQGVTVGKVSASRTKCDDGLWESKLSFKGGVLSINKRHSVK